VAVGERRLPGAARNAGIAATSAPIVGFLAADCLASSGWAQARLRRHRAGAKAVASALGPLDGGISSRAMWLNEHSPRLPLARPAKEALHGVSYDREVLERQGPFREDLLIGEDTTYNQALEASGVEIEWAPEVVALHRYPTSPLGAIADGYVRGLRRGRQKGLALTRSHLLKSALRAPTLGAARALRPEVPLSATQVAGALPLMAACSVAKAGGVLIARA
jgi:hypothetical protein